MKLLPINQLTTGMVLAKPVFNDCGVTLLNTGIILTEKTIQILKDKSFVNVCVYEDKNATEIATSKLEFSILYKNKLVNSLKTLSPDEIYALSSKLVMEIKNQQEISWDLLEARTTSDYIYRHSISVAILCVSYGIKNYFSEDKLKNLCCAALLHDIGKKDIPQEILFKNISLTPNETEVLKQHTTIGYNYLKKSYNIPSCVKTAVLLHHENWDGSGYPLGKKGNDIHEFARIIRVADTFVFLTEFHYDSNPMNSQKAIQYIKDNVDIIFDKKIVNSFFNGMNFLF